MFVELIDLLRCPRDHEETWLVAAFSRVEDRFVLEAKLGCPVCGEAYRVVDGIADFRAPQAAIAGTEPSPNGPGQGDDETRIVRHAAMLGLERPGSVIVLDDEAARLAQPLAAMTETRIVALNPRSPLGESERIAVVFSDSRIPLAQASVDGMVVTSGTGAKIEEAARTLRPGGRIVAPAGTKLGGGFRELARDEHNVVGESLGGLVALSRQPPATRGTSSR